MPRELEHVVRAAALLRGRAELAREDAGLRAPALAVARPAGAVRAMHGDLLPEELDDAPIPFFAGQLVAPRRAEDLGELRVRVLALQLVASLGQGIEELRVVEAVSELGMPPVAGHRVEVVEELVHPSVFDLQQAGHVPIVDARRPLLRPADHGEGDVEGLLVPQCWCRSSRPARILCSVYQGAQTGSRSVRRCMKSAGKADSQPPPFAFWHFPSSATIAAALVFNSSSPELLYIRPQAVR